MQLPTENIITNAVCGALPITAQLRQAGMSASKACVFYCVAGASHLLTNLANYSTFNQRRHGRGVRSN